MTPSEGPEAHLEARAHALGGVLERPGQLRPADAPLVHANEVDELHERLRFPGDPRARRDHVEVLADAVNLLLAGAGGGQLLEEALPEGAQSGEGGDEFGGGDVLLDQGAPFPTSRAVRDGTPVWAPRQAARRGRLHALAPAAEG